ncbi:PREDICTED: microsomal triglyceride transfer protein large subunit-like [Priapulus caudatus]|uniref:Microsomal triglyceride transfer protein large subunit-like n=1 Tax=Priapulus caudatus TaxID=37621 RepID=A0ABM1EMT0_PRICU|nr:PREDICTED: microsomal triglyceride transfer protein large subunit-like [Priapulus caudatus]
MRWLVFTYLVGLSYVFPLKGLKLQHTPGKAYTYDYESLSTLRERREAGPPSPGQAGVGPKVSAEVLLTVVWGQETEQLVKLELRKLKLQGATTETSEKARLFDGVSASVSAHHARPVYFVWRSGQVMQLYSSGHDGVVAENLKRAVVSLLQLQTQSGDREEVDVSGTCKANYQVEENLTVRKSKVGCQAPDYPGQFSHAKSILGSSVESTYSAIYEVGKNGILQTASGEDVHVFAPNIRRSLAAEIVTRQQLKLRGVVDGSRTVDASSVEQAAAGLADVSPREMKLQSLPGKPEESAAILQKLEDARGELAEPASVSSAKAFVSLLGFFRGQKATEERVLQLLRQEEEKARDPQRPADFVDVLPFLIDAVTAAQTDACQGALMKFLDFGREDNIELPEKYLLAASFSSQPSLALLSDVWVGIFAKGLEAIVGDAEGEEADEVASAGMQLTVLDTVTRPVVFFEGKGQLMSAIWSGAGSTPTSALTASVIMQDHQQYLPLSSGWIVDLGLTGALSVDLSGSVQISLWYQTSNSLVQSSGAAVIAGSARFQIPEAEVGMQFSGEAEALINFASDVDFSGKPLKLCMKMVQPDFTYRQHARKYEKVRGKNGRQRGFGVRLSRHQPVVGKSFLLHQKISELCAQMELEKSG